MEKEGEKLKNQLLGAGKKINDVADALVMTRQNLGYHFRKEYVDADFKEKLFGAYPDVFTNVKSNVLASPTTEYRATPGRNVTQVANILPQSNHDGKGVPYYDVDFLGGFDLVYNDQTVKPAFYIDFLPFNDCDAWINVTGKSMGPLIAHGDIVALKYQQDWQRFLLEGEIYAILTDNGFRTIKQLGAGPDKDHYMLIPYNKDEVYQPQPIPKDIITHVFRVKGNIKKFF